MKNHTNHLKCSKNDTSFKKTSDYRKELTENAKTSNKDVVDSLPLEDMIKVPPYLGSKTVSSSKNVSPVVPSNLTLFQGKRGPGRPKKHAAVKLNGRTNTEAVYSNKVENQSHKSFDLTRPSLIDFGDKLKKPAYRNLTLLNLENMKKRTKKKNPLSNASYHNTAKVKYSSAAPHRYPNRKEWLRKHKKRKKKETKEKAVNEEALKEIENLVEVFSKKCVIADKKSISEVNSQCSHPVNSRYEQIHALLCYMYTFGIVSVRMK